MNEDRFSGRSTVYAVHRPGYPAAMFDSLFGEIGFQPAMAVADVGAGTGIFSEGLPTRGCRVFAVEPNADMRAEAVDRLGARPGFTAVAGAAEATTLPDRSVEVVTVAQAFHWFDRDRFRVECRRILSGNGRVVLVWNDRIEDAPATRALAAVNRAHCPAFKGFSGGTLAMGARDFVVFFRNGHYMEREFPFAVEQTEVEFVGRALSSSYAPRPGDVGHDAYVTGLREAFERFAEGGRLTTPMVCRAYWGRV